MSHSEGVRERGLGSRLYSALFEELRQETVHLAVAGIALPNDASVAFRRAIPDGPAGQANSARVKFLT